VENNHGGPRGNALTNRELKRNQIHALFNLWNPSIKASSDFKPFKTLCLVKGPWEIKKAIYILRVFLYTSWLLNTAPVVHPCEAKQHQFTGFWFLKVALLFARTKIEQCDFATLSSRRKYMLWNVGFTSNQENVLVFKAKVKIKIELS